MGWAVALVLVGLGVGLLVGRGLGPESLELPAPDERRSEAEMFSAVAKTLREPRAFVRTAALARLFEGLDAENVEGARRAMASRASENDPVDLQVFVSAWVLLDPEAVAEEVLSWPVMSRRRIALNATVREWAAKGDTIAAGSFVEGIRDPDIRKSVMGPLVRGWALSGDVPGALALVQRIWHTEDHDVVDGFVRGVLHVYGPVRTLDLARQILEQGDGAFEKRLVQVTMGLAGREAPVQVAKILDGAVERAGGAMPDWLVPQIDQTAKVWRTRNPEAALDWLLGLAPGPGRDRALNETAGYWAIQDFEAAWAWFENERGPSAERAPLGGDDGLLLAGLVRRMARIRPAEASAWSERIAQPALREAMRKRVAFFWSANDASAASDWIASLGLEGAGQKAVRDAAVRGREFGARQADPDAKTSEEESL